MFDLSLSFLVKDLELKFSVAISLFFPRNESLFIQKNDIL